MRNLFVLAVASISFVVIGQGEAQQDDTGAFLAKVIKAHGGEEKLRASYATIVKAKGTAHIENNDIPLTLEGHFQLPDKLKLEMQLDMMGQNFTIIMVFDGEKAWANVMGKEEKAPDEFAKELKNSLIREHMTRLVPLQDKSVKLNSLGEVKVDDKETIGLQVTKQGQPDMNLYFDKTTNLLVKAEYRFLEPDSKQEVDQVRKLSDYKEFAGIKIPTKMVMHNDGKKFLELEITDFRVVPKHDASIFAK